MFAVRRLSVAAVLTAACVALTSLTLSADPPAQGGRRGVKPEEPKKEEGKKKDEKKPEEKKGDKKGDTESTKAPALQFKMKDIDGKEQSLLRYYGKVVVMVNTASKCGYTPQYKGLEELYTKYKDKGLVVLAFPANDFGKQEPGTDAEIKEFCTSKFSVTFPIFSKVCVKGKEICPLYKYLTAGDAGHKFGGDVSWNFNKFLINRKGEVCGRFKQSVDPMKDKEFIAAIEKALAEPAEGANKPMNPRSRGFTR